MAKLELTARRPGKPGRRDDNATDLDNAWARHHGEWRDTAQVASQWQEASQTDPALLKHRVRGAFWETIGRLGITLIVTREYEHLVMALSCPGGRPRVSFMRMPHPSGIAVDRQRLVVHIASTRNPNQIYDLMPVTDCPPRQDVKIETSEDRPIVPVVSRFYPGSLYMHDLAIIGGQLHANAVGHNAVVVLPGDGSFERVWWPQCIESESGAIFGQNHIQLNSIAAGESISGSYFSASCDRVTARRPGHRNFPVDGRGVIFSGQTRGVFARGLTRPHSARLHNGLVWVDNSGYGELGFAEDGRFLPVARLPGWTRGLSFIGDIAFVGTSRVIPRFRQYAPGLDVGSSLCGVHALDVRSGKTLGSIIWPAGNQIFAIDWLAQSKSSGFPFTASRRLEQEKLLFYTFSTRDKGQTKGSKEDRDEG